MDNKGCNKHNDLLYIRVKFPQAGDSTNIIDLKKGEQANRLGELKNIGPGNAR